MSFRCSSWLFMLFGLFLASLVVADEGQTSTEGGEWLERSRQLIEESAQRSVPDWLRGEVDPEALRIAQEIARESGFERDAPERAPGYATGDVLVFVSFSMPEETLQALMTAAQAADVTLVLRGMKTGSDIRETLQALKRYVVPDEPVPNVIIDPTLYKQFDISVVPTMVLVRESPLNAAKVVGAVPVDWFRRQVGSMTESADGDLGIRAEYHEIAEVDLVEEMQRRIAQIDWSRKREQAIDGFWRRRTDWVLLPDAEHEHRFEIDPSVRVTQDILGPEGQVLVSAGEQFNPLDYIPLTKTVLVFRGTDEAHLAFASELARQVRNEGRGVILLTTAVDVEEGWRSVRDMETTLQGPVYLLQSDLAQRFQLKHVPSSVSSEGSRLVIREHLVERDES